MRTLKLLLLCGCFQAVNTLDALADEVAATKPTEHVPEHAARDNGPWTPTNFDSANPKLPTLVVASDSTAATGRPKTRGWGAVLMDYFDQERINLVNAAVGGRSFRSFTREGRWQRIVEQLKPGDFVIIEFGHNDGGDPRNSKGRGDVRGIGDETVVIDQPDGTQEIVHSFGWYLRKYIREAREKGATPIVSTTTVRNIWRDGKVERGMGQMREWALQVAEQENAPFVDHSNIAADEYEALGSEQTKSFHPQDHTHTNIDGAMLNAETLIAGLRTLEDLPLLDFLSEQGRAIEPHPPRENWGTFNPRRRRQSRLPKFSLSAESNIDPRFRPLNFFRQKLHAEPPKFQFSATTSEEWADWQGELRAALTDVFGLAKLERTRLKIQAGPVDKLDGYVRKAFTIETTPGLFVPAFLLVPADLTEPRPGVLIAHGHGNGMNSLVGLDASGEPESVEKDVHRQMALQSVRAGFPTLVYDQIGFGRRRDFEFFARFKEPTYCNQPSKWGIHLGVPIAGVRVFDAMRMIDFLQQREEVLPDRIGMAGLSGGGLVTQFTAALDERVQVACVSGHLNTFEASILNLRHCLDNYTPGLGELADSGDIACLIAPRPLIIEAGTEDHIFPIEATRQAITKLQECYGLLEVPENVATDLFTRGHEFSGAKTWEFFHRHLDEK